MADMADMADRADRHWYLVIRFGEFVGTAQIPYDGTDCCPWNEGVTTRDGALDALEDFMNAAGPYEALRWDGMSWKQAFDSEDLTEACETADWDTVAVLDSAVWPETTALLEAMEEVEDGNWPFEGLYCGQECPNCNG